MSLRILAIGLALAAWPAYSQVINLQSGESLTIGSRTIQCNVTNPGDDKPLFCEDGYISNRITGQRFDRLGSSCINKTTGWLYCVDRLIKGADGMSIGDSVGNETTCLASIKGKLACNDRNLYNFEGRFLFEFVGFEDCKAASKGSTYCRGDALKDWNGNHLEQYGSISDCISHLY